jgi:hypothetical protein
MVTTLVGVTALMGGVLLVSTVVGVAVLAWCPGRPRPLSVAPTLGIAVSVLWLSSVGLVVPPGSWAAVGSLVVASLVLVAATVARRRAPLGDALREWRGLVTSLLVGFVCAVPFLAIMAGAHTSALVHLSGNHDGFFFTAIPEWLRSHTLIGSPHVMADGHPPGTPLLGSTWDLVQQGSWRVGSDSYTAALSRISGLGPLGLWFPLTLIYFVSFTAAASALAAGLGARRWLAPIVAGIATASAGGLGEVLDQHTPTLLALAVVLVLVAELLRASELTGEEASPLLVAIGLGAVTAVYTELFALVALPIAVLIVRPWWHRRRIDVRWIGAVLAWVVVLAGAPCGRALHGITGGNSPKGFRSSFRAQDGWFNGLRSLASGSLGSPVSWSGATWVDRAAVVGFVAALVVGLFAACSTGRARAFWSVLVVNVVMGWWVLGRSAYSGYPQQRFMEWSGPLLVIGALVGWSSLARRLRQRSDARWPAASAWASGTILVVAIALVAVPGVKRATGIEDDPSRRVDRSVTEVAGWVGARDPKGANTVVYARDYFTNLWTPYVLRHRPRTAYLSIYRDYYELNHFGRIAGRRWLLVDRAALADARIPKGALVEQNERFGLIDLATGPVVVTVPPLFRGRWSAVDLPVTVLLDDGSVSCRAAGRVEPCS